MRIFFASDVHGSQKCWLKFLSAAKFYNAEAIIIGGDITGKFVIPIVANPNGTYSVSFMGTTRHPKGQAQLDELKRQIANSGQYFAEMSLDDYVLLKDDQVRIDKLFNRLILERVREWVDIADQRLDGTAIRCLVSAGNDDSFDVDDELRRSQRIESPEGRVLDLGYGFEMLGVGYSNLTPWHCARDISEEMLGAKIAALTKQVSGMQRAIFNIHVPPFDSGLDTAPKLTADLRVVRQPGGDPELVPVGSTAVRDAILEHQPMLSLHGHVHESKGVRRLGNTTAVNPGSEYAEGILNGALIELDPRQGTVPRVQLVSG